MAKSDDKNLQMKQRSVVLSQFHEGSTRKIGYLKDLPYPPSALISSSHVISTTLNQTKNEKSISQLRRELREGQIQIWLLKRSVEKGWSEGQSDILSIVDTSTGKITNYEKRDEYIHQNHAEGTFDPDEYFGCNGFKRMRLVEGALKLD